MRRLPAHELAARARAAIAYAGIEQKEIAQALSVDRTTLARKLGKKGKDKRSSLSETDVAHIIERTRVGAEWFTADFNRLVEIPLPTRSLAEIAGEAAPPPDDKSRQPPESGDARSSSAPAS